MRLPLRLKRGFSGGVFLNATSGGFDNALIVDDLVQDPRLVYTGPWQADRSLDAYDETLSLAQGFSNESSVSFTFVGACS